MFPPFLRGGGGRGQQGGPNLPPLLPCFSGWHPFFLSFFPLSLFLYRNIIHCSVISPYFSCFPPFQNSHTSLPFPSRTLHSSLHQLSWATSPCPLPLFSFLNFFFQTCCGEQAFHLGEVVIIKFLLPKAVTAHLPQFSLLNMPLSFRSFKATRKYFSTCSRLFNSTRGMVAPPFPLCGSLFHPIHSSTSEGHGEFPIHQRDKPICVLERVNTINQLQRCVTHSHAVQKWLLERKFACSHRTER